MIPAAFRYEKPERIDEAVASLAQYGSDARVLAGGQSLLLLLKARAIAPKLLIDIGSVAELRGISREGDVIRIGALTTQAELAESEELRLSCTWMRAGLRSARPSKCWSGSTGIRSGERQECEV